MSPANVHFQEDPLNLRGLSFSELGSTLSSLKLAGWLEQEPGNVACSPSALFSPGLCGSPTGQAGHSPVIASAPGLKSKAQKISPATAQAAQTTDSV